jgi:hypothetical protein
MRIHRVVNAVLILVVCLPVTAGATLTVDDDGTADFSSIQSAINAALNSDEIIVRPGRYRETLSFLGKSITVRSEAGPANTVIFLEGETRIVRLDGNSTLRGFTITGGRTRVGAGILVTGGVQPSIEDNIIENNTAVWNDVTSFPGLGGAIAVEGTSNPVITQNVIRGNRSEGDSFGAYGYGGAIDISDYSSATITNNLIVDNVATDSGGAISLAGVTSSPVIITNNTIAGNRAGLPGSNGFSFGGGITVYADAETVIRNNAITGNSAAFNGGGIYFGNSTQDNTYEFNDFDGNLPNHCDGLPGNKCSDFQFFFAALYQDSAGGNYRLRSDSELIDRATGTGAPAEDRLGRARPADGDLDGSSAPDIGAFENQQEITRVRWDDPSSLRWDGSRNASVTFDVYRDTIGGIAPGPLGSCWQNDLAATSVAEPAAPSSGDGFFYLVLGEDAASGILGFDASGSQRTPSLACP